MKGSRAVVTALARRTGLWAAVVAIAKATQVEDPQRYAVVAMFALMLVSIFLLRDAMRERRKLEARATEFE